MNCECIACGPDRSPFIHFNIELFEQLRPPDPGLELFATGLGIMGVLGWRRNRKPAAKPA